MSDPANVKPATPSLRPRIGGGFGINADAIARAEEALKAMSAQFGQWLNDEIVKMDQAQADIHEKGLTADTANALYFRAHDLKGLGTTYEYPLVTRIAGSLCRLLDDAATRAEAPLTIVHAHIDAIRSVVRDQIKTDENPTGRVLAESLEAEVSQHKSR
ncbi:Hpt domain-containing protein [Brevundimonas sp. SL130]|uniref:Hpt domain-containing protein n=1 Tax=Brevundimonas sp. SL130 TaxID=2995143 RepID=UPI00226D288F|nr:Hpt domain-containing protein [Brevundimonas sp. SL130]WAC58940.1 Hpt domain-containing protein [Brevundimonas sp. SL130]